MSSPETPMLLRTLVPLLLLALAPSAVGAAPGLVGGTGDERTLAALYALRRFEGLGPGQFASHFWFDPYEGDDFDNDGSYASPYRSVAKMKSVCTSYVRCTVKGKDRVFSPLTLNLTGVGAGEGFLKGETVTWDAGASSGTALDWAPELGILVIDWDVGTPPTDGEAGLRGVASGAVADVRYGGGIANTVGGHDVYTFGALDVGLGSGWIVEPGHSYVVGEGPMRVFTNGVLPAGLQLATDYYVCAVTMFGFRLDDDPGCSSPILSYTSGGSGNHGIAGALNAAVDDPIVPDCADPDRICVLFESEDPEHPATIDGNRYQGTGYDNRTAPRIFGADPYGALAFAAGAGRGWVGWQNLNVQNLAMDAFANQSAADGKLVVLNSTARDVRNGSENRTSNTVTNNCFTSHGRGAVVAINGGPSESRVDDQDRTGSGACLAPTGSTKFTVIGTGSFRSEPVGNYASATLATTASDIVLIGHEFLSASTGSSVLGIGAVETYTKLQLAKAVLRSTPGNASALALYGGTNRPTMVRIHESTIAGNTDQYAAAIAIGNIGTGGLDFVARGLLIDDYPLWVSTVNQVNSIRNTHPFVLEGYYDDEDAAGGDDMEFFYYDPVATSRFLGTVASAQQVAESLGAVGWELYRNASWNSNGAAPGSAWRGDAEELRCQPSEECWGAYRDAYDVDLTTIYSSDSDLSCIPADVLGERICGFRFEGTHVGARGMPDADRDGLEDAADDCRHHPNGPLIPDASGHVQLDSDGDGYGNACDADYNGDGVVGGPDWALLARAFGATVGSPRYDARLDSDGDGMIGGPEFMLLGRSFGGPPGPSGVACVGTVPCP